MKIIIIRKQYLIIFAILILVVSFFFTSEQYKNISVFMKAFVEEPIRNGNTNLNKMAFTCNVDWGNEELPKLLNVLEQNNLKITFFISGRWASNNPELLKLIYDKGHEIGNHGYGHKMHSKIGREGNIDEIKRTEKAIFEVLQVKTLLFAPPAGDFDQTTIDVAKELGYKTILWSVDTIDWRKDSTSSVIIRRVMKKPHNGAILLMHPKPATVEALPVIIKQITEKGIEIVTVSELLKE